MAKAIGKKTPPAPASHCVMLCHPTEVVWVIDEVARGLASP